MGEEAAFCSCEKHQHDLHFRDYLLFYEYFHRDNGRGVEQATNRMDWLSG